MFYAVHLEICTLVLTSVVRLQALESPSSLVFYLGLPALEHLNHSRLVFEKVHTRLTGSVVDEGEVVPRSTVRLDRCWSPQIGVDKL